jgi:hypothetical protein
VSTLRTCVATAALFVAAGCTSLPETKDTFGGGLPAKRGEGTPVSVTLVLMDASGEIYDADALATKQYGMLLHDGLVKAGFAPSPDADLSLSIALEGATKRGGFVRSRADAARNVAMTVATVGIACDRWLHEVAGESVVEVRYGEGVAVRESIPMHGESSSCFHAFDIGRTTKQTQVASDLFARAAQDHVTRVLAILATVYDDQRVE